MRQLRNKNMKNFFKVIKSSVYDVEFYKSLESKATSSAFKYFLKLNLLIALLLTIIISLTVIPLTLVLTKSSNIDKVIQVFPQDLEIKIKDGQANSNVTGAYVVPVGTKNDGISKVKLEQKNYITIDTTNDFDLEKYKSSDSLVYLSKDYFVFQENGGQIKIQPLKGIPDMTISNNSISNWVYSVIPYLRALLPLAVVGILLISFASLFIGNLIFILIVSLIVLVIEKVRKINVTYGQIFKRSLHLVTAIIVLDSILFVFHFGSLWLVNLILFLWLYYSNIKTQTK